MGGITNITLTIKITISIQNKIVNNGLKEGVRSIFYQLTSVYFHQALSRCCVAWTSTFSHWLFGHAHTLGILPLFPIDCFVDFNLFGRAPAVWWALENYYRDLTIGLQFIREKVLICFLAFLISSGML